jgi:hypothetical protein
MSTFFNLIDIGKHATNSATWLVLVICLDFALYVELGWRGCENGQDSLGGHIRACTLHGGWLVGMVWGMVWK